MVVQEYHNVYVNFMKNKLFRNKSAYAITLWDLEFIMRDIINYHNLAYHTNTNSRLYRLIEDTFIGKYLDHVSVAPNYWLIKDECVKQGRLAFRLLPNDYNWSVYQNNAQCLELLVRCLVYDFNNSAEIRQILYNYK